MFIAYAISNVHKNTGKETQTCFVQHHSCGD